MKYTFLNFLVMAVQGDLAPGPRPVPFLPPKNTPLHTLLAPPAHTSSSHTLLSSPTAAFWLLFGPEDVSSYSTSRKETWTGPGTGFRINGQRMQGPSGCSVVLGRHHSCPWAPPASHLLQQSTASGRAQALLEQRIQEKDPSCPKGGNALFISFNFGQK